ncbi:MAG: O-antigen ligase family protein [Actinobacteria bacterium]|nr:O-antigen ligase family protein [Actinomycetota bacterium]
MHNHSLLISKKLYFRNIIIFLIFFIIFFLYQAAAVYGSSGLFLFVNILILIIFFLTAFNAKAGLYLFIFTIPIFNSLTTILKIRPVPMLLFFFFAFFLGFLLNFFDNDFKNRLVLIKQKIFDREIGIAVLAFIVLLVVSLAVTVFRYSNFYPFITDSYHNLKVNNAGVDSTSAIWWTLTYFFNYVIAFAMLFAVFNILNKFRDIIVALVVAVFSAVLASFFGFYQYFVNPYIGNFKLWVDAGRLNSTFTDPNALGGYCILLFPIFLTLIIISKKWYLKLIFSILTVPFIFMMLFSGSRSALLGMLLSLVIFLIPLIARLIKLILRLPGKKKIIVSLTILIIIVIVVIFILGIFLTSNPIKSKILGIGLFQRMLGTIKTFITYYKSSGFLESLKSISNYRYIFWNQAINMTKDFSSSGVGAGSYIITLPNYLYNFDRGFPKIDFTGNYYLQVLSELGFTGLILILFIYFLFIKKVIIYFRLRRLKNLEPVKNSNYWLLYGLFTSFITMLAVQFFGPFTNFMEIQFTFWLIVSLMITYIKISQESTGEILKGDINSTNMGEGISRKSLLWLSDKLNFSLRQKISLAVIVLVFAGSLLASSLSDLSIAATQDEENWSNNYGFSDVAKMEGKKYRWTSADASEVLNKEGTELIIPVQDGYPGENKKPIVIKFYIDNLLIKKIKVEDDSWYNVNLKIPKFVSSRFTLTIVNSRTWVPKEMGVNNDTRKLGIRVGEYKFIK